MGAVVVAVVGLLLPGRAAATNGLDLIAYEARAAGMGGAATALAHSSLGLATNPAAITRVGWRVDANLSLMVPLLGYDDRVVGVMDLNRGKDADPSAFPLFGVAVAAPLGRGLHAGLGVWFQGGMGATFTGLRGFQDDDPGAPLAGQPQPVQYSTYSQLLHLKVAPTLAWRYRALSLGASLHLGAARLAWRHGGMQFPEADGDHLYVAHSVDFSSDWAFSPAGRFGAQVALLEQRLLLGVSYLLQAGATYRGTVTVDRALEYRARTSDLRWAQQVSLGAAGRLLGGRLLVAADLRWADWSRAVDTVTFTDEAGAMPPMPFQLRWRDGLVVAVGAEYALIPETLHVRLGYNWGRAPVTAAAVNPLFPALAEHHLTVGLGVRLWRRLSLQLAVEYALPRTSTSDDRNQLAFEPAMPPATPAPNGYQAAVTMQQVTTHVALGYSF